jgi:hypothetical protein
MKKKYSFVLIVFLIILICLLVYFIFQRPNKQEMITPETKQDKVVIPARPNTFNEGRNVFIDTVKLARIASLKNNQEDTKNYTKQAFILWRDVVNEFINNPPNNIHDKKKWVNNINNIYESIQEADQLIKDSKFTLATDKLDESRLLLNNLGDQKTSDKIERKLFPLLISVKKIDQASDLSEARKYLEELKLAYTEIKNIQTEEDFKELCQNFEDVLSEVDNATTATFARAQKKLMPAFLAIYEKY